MAKSFKNLKKNMSPSAQKKADKKTEKLLSEMCLQELRQARQMSQVKLAEELHTKQANISQIERRTDMYISTLRDFIHAIGGELDILAKFPEGTIQITQFCNI